MTAHKTLHVIYLKCSKKRRRKEKKTVREMVNNNKIQTAV